MKKIKVAYFESGDICEFRCGRSRRNAIIKDIQDLGRTRKGYIRPRVRFARGWTREEVRKEFVWW